MTIVIPREKINECVGQFIENKSNSDLLPEQVYDAVKHGFLSAWAVKQIENEDLKAKLDIAISNIEVLANYQFSVLDATGVIVKQHCIDTLKQIKEQK